MNHSLYIAIEPSEFKPLVALLPRAFNFLPVVAETRLLGKTFPCKIELPSVPPSLLQLKTYYLQYLLYTSFVTYHCNQINQPLAISYAVQEIATLGACNATRGNVPLNNPRIPSSCIIDWNASIGVV